MPVEGIAIRFEGSGADRVQKTAEAVTAALKEGEYVGYIAVQAGGDLGNRFAGVPRTEGIVLLVDK